MSTQVAIPQDVMQRLAERAKEAAAKERPAIGRISLKSGQMSYAGVPIKDNKMEVVVLEAVFKNVLYMGKYNPDNIVNPNCFALAAVQEELVPHENVVNPKAEKCSECPLSEWGSDPEGGRGKACKEGRRLVVMPASALETPEQVKTAELAILDLPVTSVKNYGTFVNVLSATLGVPAYAAVTQVSTVADAKTQFKVTFTPMRIVPSHDLLLAIESKLSEARNIGMEPFESTVSDEDQAKADAEVEAKRTSKKKY